VGAFRLLSIAQDEKIFIRHRVRTLRVSGHIPDCRAGLWREGYSARSLSLSCWIRPRACNNVLGRSGRNHQLTREEDK
jgi:hypothetical protein